MKSTFSFFVFSIFISNVVGEKSSIVSTKTGGQVVGTIEKSFSSQDFLAFRRIPFAEPPIGNLRFKPPVDKKPWEGILDGSLDGPPCMQLNQFNESIVVGSEDCLTLNVYTPEVPSGTGSDRLRPVLVYIHGGRWLVGSASSKVYSPIYLMDQDILVVSIQYRLGALGFLSTDDEIAPGNYGLLDQVKALEWIQGNIAAFGGDPNRVTVSGQSAGGASSHMHLFSPLSKGLLHGAIALSGSAINYWAHRFTDHTKYTKRQAEAVGCPSEPSSELIDCLRKLDSNLLTLTQPLLHDFFGGTPAKLPLSPFAPRVDKESDRPFLPTSALEMIRNGDVDSIPLMIGVTSQEGAWLVASFYGQDNKTILKSFQHNLKKAVSAMTGNYFSEEKIEKLISFYFGDTPVTDDSLMIPMSELMSDLKFNFELFMAAHLHARRSHAPVFVNKFDFRGLWTFAHEFEETKHDYGGVAHVDDLRYVFKLVFGPELSTAEIEVMKRYTGFISEFVKYGQPTHGDSTKHYNYYWRNYQKERGQYMVTDVPIKSGMSREKPFESSSRPGRMELWREMFDYQENWMKEDFATPSHDEL